MDFAAFLVFVSLFGFIEPYKYLIGTPIPVKSLNILGESLSRRLVDAGHEVTLITVYPLKNPPKKNFRQIDISSVIKILEVDPEVLDVGYIMENDLPMNEVSYLHKFALETAEATFENENLRALLEDPNEHFDAVIMDHIESDVYASFAVLYDAPLIVLYSMGAHAQVLRLLDQPPNPAYACDHLSPNIPPFNFMQRVHELWYQSKWLWYKKFVTEPAEEAIYKKYFGPLLAKRGRTLPDFQDAMYNVSLVLGNEHHAIGGTISTPQNFKHVGGYHIDPVVQPLPKDLQDLMDNSKHGVIYFSMGSTWKSKDIPKSVTENLLKLFGELKQTVIWKYEVELPNVPKNVHIVKWAPQPSILSHPNLLLFITHGGLLSSTETLHYGVPVIGIPIYYDQFMNVERAVSAGYSLKVKLSLNMHVDLKTAINKMLNDKSYAKRAKELSAIFHDRVMAPQKEVVFWAEHVVRTRGAKHLRSPSFFVPFYQRMYLDLLLAILVFSTILVLLFMKIVKAVKKNIHEKVE